MKLSSSVAYGYHVDILGRPKFLMAKEDDKGGGGGGGDDKGDDKGKPDPALVKAIASELGGAINAAVKSHLDREKKARKDEIAEIVKAALAESKAAPSGGDGDPPEGDDKGKGDDKGGKSPKVDTTLQAQIEKLQRDLDKQKKDAADERTKRQAAELKAMRDEERQLIAGLLAGSENGGRPVVRAEVMDDVAEILAKRLVRDPNDPSSIYWKGANWKDVDGHDNSDNYADVKAEFAKWMESPKGKAYAPPAQLGGGGFGPPRGGGPGARKGNEEMTDAEIGQMIYGGGARR